MMLYTAIVMSAIASTPEEENILLRGAIEAFQNESKHLREESNLLREAITIKDGIISEQKTAIDDLNYALHNRNLVVSSLETQLGEANTLVEKLGNNKAGMKKAERYMWIGAVVLSSSVTAYVYSGRRI